MNKRIIKRESAPTRHTKKKSSTKTNSGVSNSFLRKIISLLKKEELI